MLYFDEGKIPKRDNPVKLGPNVPLQRSALNEWNWRREPIHRWYFITEGLPISIVRSFLRSSHGDVLDPFLGCGTVLVEAGSVGLNALGIDVNPFMCFASSVKTGFHRVDKRIIIDFLRGLEIESHQFSLTDCPATLRTYYSSRRLGTLLRLKHAISRLSDSDEKDFLKLAFVKASLKYGDIRMSPSLRFHRRERCRPILKLFTQTVGMMMDDLSQPAPTSEVEVLRADSKNLHSIHGRKFSLVLTSPPYCNNVDFVRHSQLPLYWLDYCRDARDLRLIRKASLTSCEAMAYAEKASETDDPEIKKTAAALMKSSDRRFHYVISQYFSGMTSHFSTLGDVVRKNGRLVYVIGDSWMQGVHVNTPLLLARLAKAAGFHSVKLHFLRQRKSGRRHSETLREYILTARH